MTASPPAPPPLPEYRFPAAFVARWAGSALAAGRRRDLGADGRALFAGREPRPRVEGVERLPAAGPCVLAMNHYERPGMRVWWCVALATAAAAGRRGGDPPVRWLMTDRFEAFRAGGVRWPDAWAAWLLARVARAYDCLPVARPGAEAAARASALREARRTLRAGGLLGVTPEAASGAGPEIGDAWPGAGASLAWLSDGAVPIAPAAVFEDASGRPIARFGPPFTLERGEGEAAADAVMAAIAALLPPALRGPRAAQRAPQSCSR